jgi:hypothetical protein
MTEQKLTRHQWLICFVLVAAIVALHAWSLMRFPAPSVDEAWLVSRAWAFTQTGRAFGPLDAGIADRFEGPWVVNQWLITALQSLALRPFPVPSLLAVRGLALLWGSVLLAANYWITHRVGGHPLALASTLLLALSRAFFYSAHSPRYDIMAAALGYLALALVLNDGASRFWVNVLAGLAVGLAVETHLNTLIFGPAILALYWLDEGWSVARKARFWGFVVGAMVGLGIYLALHVLPYPQTYFGLYNLLFGLDHKPPFLTPSLGGIEEVLVTTGNLVLVASASSSVLALAAIPVLVHRRSVSAKRLLVSSVTLMAGAALLIPNKTGHYAILVAPAVLWLVAAFLLEFVKQPWRGRWGDYASRVLIWGLVAGSIALSLASLPEDWYSVYRRVQSSIDQTVRPGDKIMASQTYWLGLYDHTYYSWELLFLYPRVFPGKTLADAFQEYKPDLFVIDGGMNDLISDTIDPSSRWRNYHLPRAELFAYLEKHARLVAAFEADVYGPVRVYRLNWAGEASSGTATPRGLPSP